MEKDITRRNFLKLLAGMAGMAVSGGLACLPDTKPVSSPPSLDLTPEQRRAEINARFASDVRKMMDIDSVFTRQAYAALAYKRIYETTEGMTDRKVGIVINSYGKELTIWLDKTGEPFVSPTQKTVPVEYPPSYTTKTISLNQQHHFVIYAGQETIARLNAEKNLDIINKFLQEYFAGSQARKNVIHWIYTPVNQKIPLLDIGNFGKTPDFTLNTTAQSYPLRNTATGEIGRQDVMFYVANAHEESLTFGFDLEAKIRSTLVNEATNWLAVHTSKQAIKKPTIEGFTTLAELLTIYDLGASDLILGGSTHRSLTPILASEMQRTGKIKK